MECVVQGILEAKNHGIGAILYHYKDYSFPWWRRFILLCSSDRFLTSSVGEYILPASDASHVDALEVLLQGLCGGLRETIKVHEICLKTGPNLGAVASEIHLCCSLSQPEPVWSVRHVGGAMRGAGADQLPALVRPVLEAGISNNSLRFMYALGYKLDYEMLRMGFSFQMHKTVPIAVTITIAVTAVHRLPKIHAVDDAQPVTPGLHMVQLTAPASPDTYSDVVGAISGLAEYLAPLVHLSKPGVPAGVVPTASTAAAALISRGGHTKVL